MGKRNCPYTKEIDIETSTSNQKGAKAQGD